MTTKQKAHETEAVVADAIREVTARAQNLWEAGQRSKVIDLFDVLEILLAVADKLDPDGILQAENDR